MQRFVGVRGEHSQAGVTAAGVVESRDPFADRLGQLDAGSHCWRPSTSRCMVDQKDSMRALSTLDATRAHGSQQAGRAQPVPEHPGRVLSAPVGIDYGSVGAALPAGRLQGIDDQFAANVVSDRPAHDLAAERIQNRAAVDPPVRGQLLDQPDHCFGRMFSRAK